MRIFFLMLVLLPAKILRAQAPLKQELTSNIILPSLQGDTLELAELKGKVVLVDFWASWCGPCRVSNRGLTVLYNKFHEKGFEIFSVSIDSDIAKWRDAVRLDKMTWLQVNQPGNWNASILKIWGIKKLPASYLLGKDGRVVASDASYGVLESWLKALLETESASN